MVKEHFGRQDQLSRMLNEKFGVGLEVVQLSPV